MTINEYQKRVLELLESIDSKMNGVNLPPIPEEEETPWFHIAEGELGTREIKGRKHNQRVLEYHASTGKKLMTDEIPWCASFVGWCLQEAGYKDTDSAAARSYLTAGKKCELKRGAIVVFWRESPKSWKGHVGFVFDWNDDYIWTLGGNQGNEVSVRKYDRDKVLGYRWPESTSE